MIRFSILLASILATAALMAQSPMYMPRNLEKAYQKGTRSATGAPGPNYWQNKADYRIEAQIDPKTRLLKGSARIEYFNQSPDTLKLIRLKLAHDLYRKNAQRAYELAEKDMDNGVEIRSLQLNGASVGEKQQRRHNSFLDIQINESPLLPGAKATIQVEWQYALPADEGAPRECVCDSTSFFVPYWYPQVAVYDDTRGWADAPYTGLQEFYNDFSDYDVSVTMPYGFQVWATGEWQNAGDALTSAYLKRWKTAQTSTDVVKIFTEQELKNGGVYNKAKQHTFRFIAKSVPDFAFGTSDHYNWDAASVVVDQKNNRRTFVSAAYHSKSEDYPHVARIAADGIGLMSTWLPGYPFPYPSMTVFNGNDGMEYPMMCNDVSTGKDDPTGLTVHEVSHTYFPFMMGINEQEYAWMDEGWASFFDYMLTDSMSGEGKGNYRSYGKIAGTDNDVPPMVRSRFLNAGAYRNASYQRPQAAYVTLYEMLGHERFQQCMRTYMERWKGKHPIPQDFFNTWNEASGQNLDWFWKPWFFEFGAPDLAVEVEHSNENNVGVMIFRRVGNMPVSIAAEIEYESGEKQKIRHSAELWRTGNPELRLFGKPGKRIKSVKLGDKDIPDANPANNQWPKG